MRLIGISVILFLAGTAWGLDIDAPAKIEVSVVDSAGKPVAGAAVRLRLDMDGQDKELAKAQTDAAGRVEIKVPPPAERTADQLGWSCRLEVAHEGLIPHTQFLQLFPDALIKFSVTLATPTTTVICLLDEAGKPLPNVRFSAEKVEEYSISLSGDWLRTDADGQYRWVHAPSKMVYINGDGWSRRLKDAAQIDVTLTATELKSSTPRRLEGRLLTADGKPAAGWFVAEAKNTGAWSMGAWWTVMYSCQVLTPVDADGQFALEIYAHAHLAVVSPEGVPFIFMLNPSSWSAGPRRLTLPLPPVLRTHKGTLLLADGKPAAGFPIIAQRGSAPEGGWELHMRENGFNFRGFPLAHPQLRPITTDAQGRYEIPIYAGNAISYQTREGWSVEGSLDRDSSVKVTGPQTPPKEEFGDYTRTIIRVADAAGKELPNVRVWAENKDKTLHCDQFVDSRGIHLFTNFKDMDLHILADGWAEHVTTISPEATAVEVVMPEEKRFKPLKGKVLDPDGKPVAGVRISPYTVDNSGKKLRIDCAVDAIADANGGFSLPGPDHCLLDLSRYDDTGYIPNLPGWAEPHVTAKDRDIVIRLSPVGSCRVLLPATLEENVHLIKLGDGASDAAPSEGEDANDDENVFIWGGRETFYFRAVDKQQGAFESTCLRPGKYKLTVCASEEGIGYWLRGSRDLLKERITVAPGRETLVDLRKRAELLAVVPQPKTVATVKVRQGGKAVSGAAVCLFWTDATDDPRIAKWIVQLADDRYAARDEAGKLLAAVGQASRTALREATTQPDAEIKLRAAKLLEDMQTNARPPVRAISADLSDQNGTAGFEVEKGRKYVAVAYMPGAAIGWATFAGGAETASIDLRATRQVKVLPGEHRQYIDAEFCCYWSFTDVSDEVAMAVMHVLNCRAHRPGEGLLLGGSKLYSVGDGPKIDLNEEVLGAAESGPSGSFILHDAPTGVELSFQTIQGFPVAKKSVRITADSPAVVEVKLEPAEK